MIKKSFISVKKNSAKKNSTQGGGQLTACGHIGPESSGFAIVVEKLLSSFSRWTWNGGHRAWHKSPVTFLQQVTESEPAKVWPSAREATRYLCAWQPDGLGMVVDFSTTLLFLTIEEI